MDEMVLVVHPLCLMGVSLVMGAITSYQAHKRGRNPVGWFIVGTLLGLIGLLLLLFLSNPVKTPPEATAPIPDSPPLPLLWHILNPQGQPEGPISLVALKALHEKGSLSPDTYVWNDTMSEWAKVHTLPALLDEFDKPNPTLSELSLSES